MFGGGRPAGAGRVATVFAAAFAAALSLLGGLWPRRRGSKARLELAQSLGAFPRPGGEISPLFVLFAVSNPGDAGAKLSDLHVETRDGRLFSLGDLLGGEKDLPCALASGETVRFWVRAKALARVLKDEGYGGRPRVRLVALDGSGNRFDKRFGFRVDDYLELKDE